MTGREEKKNGSLARIAINALFFLIILFAFLLALELIAKSFTLFSGDVARSIILLTANPFVSLFIGLLLTAVVQSSSTVTSMIVAVVASGSLELQNAVPMIMGANIGTTLTSTLVSLAFITRRNEFRKAVSAGTVHDFFNILVTIILFPLEFYYGFLSQSTQAIIGWISPAVGQGGDASGFEWLFTKTISSYIVGLTGNAYVAIFLGFVLLFAAVKGASRLIYRMVRGELSGRLRDHLQHPMRSFLWGLAFTGAVQSSSITTSFIVPFVATGRITLKKAFPFILGANLGTTITAFIAALFKSEAAVSIAVAHFLFNLAGVVVFLPFGKLRNMPVSIANGFGRLTIKYRIAGFVYIILMFFLIPFLLIYFNQNQ